MFPKWRRGSASGLKGRASNFSQSLREPPGRFLPAAAGSHALALVPQGGRFIAVHLCQRGAVRGDGYQQKGLCLRRVVFIEPRLRMVEKLFYRDHASSKRYGP